MKNKTKIFRVAALLFVLALVSTVMISGTFAKYTSEYSGSDTALVAKWSLDVTDGTNDFNLADDGAATLDLFSHLYDVNIISNAGTNKIIAPGVKGEFTLSVTNNSDVAAGVTFEFAKSGDAANVPMEYSLDNFATAGKDLAALAGAIDTAADFATIAADATPSVVTKTVYWRWPYEVKVEGDPSARDETDTGLGIDSADKFIDASTVGERTEYILSITATATQLEPGVTP